MSSYAQKQAELFQQIFFSLSDAVDNFRLRNLAALSDADLERLKEQSRALNTRGQQYTAEALETILEGIQPHLKNIQNATQAAKDALAHLKDVAKGIKIVDTAVALVGSIAAGDLGSIAGDVEGLLQAVGGD